MATAEVVAGAVKSFQEDGKGKKDEGTALEPKDFFWDQFLKYISSAILALTVLNVSVEFLRGGGVQCFPPTVTRYLTNVDEEEVDREFSIRQSDYLNTYCSESIPSSEYFPLFILVQGILLIAPHFIWGAIFNGDFDSFFAVTEKLDRLRDRKTGVYDPTNFDRVEKLELEFGSKRRRIFFGYISKLLLQFAVCLASIVFSEIVFVNFNFAFDCPADFSETNIPDKWPLNATIPCVYVSLRVLSIVRYADYILVAMAMCLVLVGLGWCFIRHTKELGAVGVAQFVFQSCLTTKSYVFPQLHEVRMKVHPTDKCWLCCFPLALLTTRSRGCIWCSVRFMLFTPRIQNDLDFLELCLFRADSSHGRVFKEIQIDKELRKLHGQDHQLLHLFLNVQLDMMALMDEERKEKALSREERALSREAEDEESDDSERGPPVQVIPREKDLHHFFKMGGFAGNPEKYAFTHYQSLLGNTEWRPVKGIRDRLYGFVMFSPKHVDGEFKGDPKTDMAMDISFGSSGYALVLARAFKKVISVNFHPFFRNEKEPVKKEIYYTNYVSVNFPENIFTHSSDTINQAVQQMVHDMFTPKKKPADFIVVGPFTDDSKRVTVTLTIEMLYTAKAIEEGAILLAVRPLKIGHRVMTKKFSKYEPPLQLFDHKFHNTTVLPRLKEEVGTDFQEVDGCSGITVVCGDTSCVFEFITYKYTGKTEEPNPMPKVVTLQDLLGPPPPGNEREDIPDNNQPVFIDLGHSQSVPAPSHYPPHSVGYPEPSASLPPNVRPQHSIPPVGSAENFSPWHHSSRSRPMLQRAHTFDQASLMGSQSHRPSLHYQRSVIGSPAESGLVSDMSSQAGSFDSNRVNYMPEDERRETEQVGGGKGESIGNRHTGRPGGIGGIRNRGRGGMNGSGREGSLSNVQQLNGRRKSRQSRVHSSTSTVLSSIEDEDESEVTNGEASMFTAGSPQPVFEDYKETQ